jgi:hypothetical protein
MDVQIVSNQPETFRGHLPALAGSIVGTLISAVIASHLFGAAGTTYGLAFGGMVSGTTSWWGERAIRRSQAIATAKMKAARNKQAPLSATETQMIEAVHGKAFDKRNPGIPYRTIALIGLTAVLVGVLTVIVLDRVGAREVATFTPAPRPTVTRTVEVPTETFTAPASSASFTPSDIPSSSASASPTVVPDTSPDATPIVVSPSESMTTAVGVTSASSPTP